MKPILTDFTYSIYRRGERIMAFFFFFLFSSQSDKNSGCYGNLQLPLTYNRRKEKLLFIAISLQVFWQKFYRNIPCVVLYKTYHFCPNLWIWLVAMATKILHLWKKYYKIFSSEAIRRIKLKLCRNVLTIWPVQNWCFFFFFFFFFFAVVHALSLLWQLKVSMDLWESEN